MKISTSPIGPDATDQGFTLLELLVVLCLAGIVSGALAFAIGGALDRSSLQITSTSLASQLGKVSNLAQLTGRDQTVVLLRRSGLSEVFLNGKVVRVSKPISVELISALEARASEGDGAIVFFGAGGSSGGTLKLSDGKDEASLSIDWLSGRVRLLGADR